ncbi:unnamed protein product [Cuscuta campestris]|uniref:Malonyl-CoA decarboxylase N-terminal domain-containing protein n=1 Tax=Cuscuta campestris TaxID=132261 RepID=A0A484MK63_9ASTE|nr:unnamed protein product [Cuscuta campestris]
MNKRGLEVLMRTKVRPSISPPSPNTFHKMKTSPRESAPISPPSTPSDSERDFTQVRDWMDSAISMINKAEILDAALDEFSEGYVCLSHESRRKLFLALGQDYDLQRAQVCKLMKQYLGLQLPSDKAENSGNEEEGSLSAFYRIERNLRHALKPMNEVLFERLNTHPGGLKFLSDMRADIISILA